MSKTDKSKTRKVTFTDASGQPRTIRLMDAHETVVRGVKVLRGYQRIYGRDVRRTIALADIHQKCICPGCGNEHEAEPL